MRSKEEINKEYNVTCLQIGHNCAQIELRNEETEFLVRDKNLKLVHIKSLAAELKELERAEHPENNVL